MSRIDMKPMNRPSVPQKLRTKQVMIIDEDPAVCAMIRETLKPLGYAVLGSGAVSEGMKALDEIVIDLVIADIFMASAFQAAPGVAWGIQEVRKHQSSTKVIGLSAAWSSTVSGAATSAALRTGADVVLSKPLRSSELEEAVTALLGGPIEIADLSS